MTENERLELNTAELQRGDIVHAYGMRVLLDVDPIVSLNHANTGTTVYAWVGLVLNAEEVRGHIPGGWLHHNGIGQPIAEPRWNVQGNTLARWSVERP